MTEQLFYKCLLCGRSTELNKMKVIDIDGIKLFQCQFCRNGLK
jgi:hypothetical protein